MAENAYPLPAPDEKLVRIFDTEQETEAMVVRALLESAGIDCQLGESENSPEVLPVGGIGLLVREEEAGQARQIIAEYQRSPEQKQAEEADFDETALQAGGDLSEGQKAQE